MALFRKVSNISLMEIKSNFRICCYILNQLYAGLTRTHFCCIIDTFLEHWAKCRKCWKCSRYGRAFMSYVPEGIVIKSQKHSIILATARPKTAPSWNFFFKPKKESSLWMLAANSTEDCSRKKSILLRTLEAGWEWSGGFFKNRRPFDARSSPPHHSLHLFRLLKRNAGCCFFFALVKKEMRKWLSMTDSLGRKYILADIPTTQLD